MRKGRAGPMSERRSGGSTKRRGGIVVAAALAALMVGALLAPSLLAAPATGAWKGTWVMNDGEGPDYSNAPLFFKVLDGGKKLKALVSHKYPVFCPAAFPSFQVKSVEFPAAPIRGGEIHSKYAIREGGQKIGQLELKGKLGAREGKGWLAYEDAGCYGTTHWRAWAR